jgi:hypothetical protein
MLRGGGPFLREAIRFAVVVAAIVAMAAKGLPVGVVVGLAACLVIILYGWYEELTWLFRGLLLWPVLSCAALLDVVFNWSIIWRRPNRIAILVLLGNIAVAVYVACWLFLT